MENYIPLKGDIEKEKLDQIGGKGRGFNLLLKADARIPLTVVIPPGVELKEACKEILDYFLDSKGTKKYAVRSSASMEDGKVKSFAGQFESFLRITDLTSMIEAAEKCRKSGESFRVKEYSGTKEDMEVSVIVQEMIEAECSGVLFTCDPVTGSLSHITVEAVDGTSEDLMGGTVSGERYILGRDGEIISKTDKLLFNESILKKLVLEALEIEKKLEKIDYEGPLDFEWAIKDGEIIWLQVRPVTVSGRGKGENEEIILIEVGKTPDVADGEIHWTSMNAQEAIPGVATTLSGDIIVEMLDTVFMETYRMFGVKVDQKYSLIDLFKGRAFLNVTDLKTLNAKLPLTNPESAVDRLLTGSSDKKTQIKISPSLIKPFILIILKELNMPSSFTKLEKEEKTIWYYPDEQFLSELDKADLLKKIEDSLIYKKGFSCHAVGTMSYMHYFSLMEELCRKYDTDPAFLFQGLGTLRFASAAAELKELAYSGKDCWEVLFDEDYKLRDDWKERLMKEESLQKFNERFINFIDEYGHLGNGSIDLYLKSWREERDRVLVLVGNILKQGDVISREEYLNRLRNEREKAIKEFKGKLSFFDRLKFPIILYLMHRSAPFRENFKFLAHRRMAVMKVYFQEIGRRMKQEGFISEIDDVFFLKLEETKEFLRESGISSLVDTVMERKNEWKQRSLIPCPLHRIEGKDKIRLYFAASSKGKKEFQGTSGSSGTVIGTARVIGNIAEADRLNPGEILVTFNTDPSWTTLFSIAGGVVVEVGSVLSHGAVVAREAGIPAVLGISGIVGAIKDGDKIVVDGSAGKVTIQSP